MKNQVNSATIIPYNSSNVNDVTNEAINEADFKPKDSAELRFENGDSGVSMGLASKKVIVIASVVGFVAITALVVGLAVGLTRNKTNPTDPQNPNNITPTPTVTCADIPSECAGVSSSVSDFIFSNYTNNDEIRSLLQLSRSLNGISSNASRADLIATYRTVMRSAECLALNMPDTYASSYQNLLAYQLQDTASLEQYFQMIESFSGQPIRQTPPQDVATACGFNLTNPPARRLLQAYNCDTPQTAVMVLMTGYAPSPNQVVMNLNTIKSYVDANATATFDGGYVALSSYRNTGSLGVFLGWVTAYQQKQREAGIAETSRLDILRALLLMVDHGTFSLTSLPYGLNLLDAISIVNFVMSSTALSYINDIAQYELTNHKNFISQQVSEGKKVLIVGHGEGTMYANQVYNGLSTEEKAGVSLAFVAPYASSMADGSSFYITNPGDLAVEAFRSGQYISAITPPLVPNVANISFGLTSDFGENHALEGYLAAYRSQFLDIVLGAKQRITQPARTLGSGPITVVLSWDSQPDLDLHVFEPNFHVFYSQKNGTNGFLDLDDTNGYGPEHYYTGCNLQLGDYIVKVNYYSGSAPSAATVTVSAGAEFFSKDLILPTARASAGDADPQNMICTITVSRSAVSGEYIFRIVG